VVREAGGQGLQKLFSPSVKRKTGWTAVRGDRPDNVPTCEQAEVLYPERLSLEYLRKIYVRNGDEHDRIWSFLALYKRPDVEVVIDEAKFAGRPN